MGTYTPKRNLYKPDIGEKGWGDEVNRNWDILDAHTHERAEITDFFASPFWDNIPDKPTEFPPQPHTHEISDIISLADKLAYHDTQIGRIKKDLLTIALNVMMNKALVHAETKDFYSIIADVITDEYPYGFKNTFETIPSGVKFDNDGGGTWTRAIKITLTTVPSEYAQYKIVIQFNTMQIYSADGTLKAEYGAETGVASDFWNNVKSDGSDIRIADQNYSQLYFWIEEWDYANKKAVIWVKIPANTTELYIVYGNPLATKSDYENGEQVFEFFDDFEDLEGWTDYQSAWSIIAEENLAYGKKTQDDNNLLQYDSAVELDGKIVEAKMKGEQLGYADPENWDCIRLVIASGANDISPSIRLEITRGWGFRLVVCDVDGTRVIDEVNLASVSTGVWYILGIYVNEENVKAFLDGEEKYSGSHSAVNFAPRYIAFNVYDSSGWVDWVRVLKLADPAEFGDAEIVTLVTTGDFITVTFDFPEGVDKLLITVDTDAQAVYYSTDDGQTWNAIEPDTETPLPETAYSIKWKFEFATYVRGYAFITW